MARMRLCRGASGSASVAISYLRLAARAQPAPCRRRLAPGRFRNDRRCRRGRRCNDRRRCWRRRSRPHRRHGWSWRVGRCVRRRSKPPRVRRLHIVRGCRSRRARRRHLRRPALAFAARRRGWFRGWRCGWLPRGRDFSRRSGRRRRWRIGLGRCRRRRARRRQLGHVDGDRRGERERAQARAQVENLAARALDPGRWRARRGLLHELRILEQRDQLARIRRFPAQIHIALRILATPGRLQFELRKPGVVGQHARHLIEHVHDAGIGVFPRQDVVVVVLHAVELLPHRVRRLRPLCRFRFGRHERDHVLPLLRQRHQHRREGYGKDERERRPQLPAPPVQRLSARSAGNEVEPRCARRRWTRNDRNRYRAPFPDLLAGVVDNRPQRRDPVDTNRSLSRLAADDDSIVIELLGPKWRMPIEIVRQHLREIVLDRGGEDEFLAQHAARSQGHGNAGHGDAAGRLGGEARDRGAARGKHCRSVADQRHSLGDGQSRRAVRELGAPDRLPLRPRTRLPDA